MNLKELADNQVATFLPKYIDSYPGDWSSFINYVDYCYKADWVEQSEEEKKNFLLGGRVRKGLLQIWGFMTMFAENPFLRPDLFPGLKEMVGKIENDYTGEMHRSSFAIINLSDAENVTYRHNDRTHNMYVQCIGSVTWRIYKSLDSNEFDQYDLYPGDAIWVPAGVSHEVLAKEPRAAITIAFNGLDKD